MEQKHAEVVGRCGSGWEAVEVSGRQAEGPEDVWKRVEDQEGVGRGQEGLEEVRKAVGEGERGGKTWESNGTLQFLTIVYSIYVGLHLQETFLYRLSTHIFFSDFL